MFRAKTLTLITMKRSHILFGFDRKWLLMLILTSTFSLVLLLIRALGNDQLSAKGTLSYSIESESTAWDSSFSDRIGPPELPRFAYLISGTKGQGRRLRRLLQAAYHPRNYYLLHLDLEATDGERLELAKYVKSEAVMRDFRNVMVVGKADLVTYKGPTMIASILHAIAILLKQGKGWDWFINLSASDYPLMPQDGWSLSC